MYENRVNTNYQGKKIPKENASYKCFNNNNNNNNKKSLMYGQNRALHYY